MTAPREKLYRVVFERREQAEVFVLAADADDLAEQVADGMSDLPVGGDWQPVTDIWFSEEADDSDGRSVWSGGGDGDWLAPIEGGSS